ncbi:MULTISPECIES: phosphotransferase family protein [unclassified Nocardioides]|uniref:phosphotransferase family protein n=1 Tax=unclassified Nocardioides TaxID=2615069 RepID=UPI00301508A0
MDPWPQALAHLAAGHVERLGGGTEGAVYRLRPGVVAKVWHDRTPEELAPLRRAYDDVAAARPAVRTPMVRDVLVLDGRTVTVEDELPGRSLQERLDPAADELPGWAVDAVVATLAALRTVGSTAALRALPVLGERTPFRSPGDDFPGALAGLVERRAAASVPELVTAVPDLDVRLEALGARLAGLGPTAETVVHGDLFGANLHVDPDGRAVAVLDFGFLTTAGDPRFDAGVTAGIMDMYGPHAAQVTRLLTAELARQLGDDPAVLVLHRAAYAVATSTLFGRDLDDGHFRWCVDQLTDPATADVLGL